MIELISRQAALAEIDKNREALLQSGMVGAEHILVHYGRRVIEELPSSGTKPGKWKKHVLKNANVPWGYDCSACGAWFIVSEDAAEKYYYCPNCGHPMEMSEE